MAILKRAAEIIAPGDYARHGPLPLLLLVLTTVTGLVDAVSFFGLGHVFVANMTGNVIFLGFAVAASQEFSIPATSAALAAFLTGAFAGGRLGLEVGQHRGRLLAIATSMQIALVSVSLVIVLLAPGTDTGPVRYALIVLLGLTMGLQSAAARRLGVPDINATVLTMTLTALAADTMLPGSARRHPGRRIASVLTMLFGAAVGAVLVFKAGVGVVLALILALLVLTGFAAWRAAASSAAWTAG